MSHITPGFMAHHGGGGGKEENLWMMVRTWYNQTFIWELLRTSKLKEGLVAVVGE
jgi:hypothetical protein